MAGVGRSGGTREVSTPQPIHRSRRAIESRAYAAGTGSDKTMSAASVNQPVDSSVNAFSAGTNDYSIYADILR